MFTFVNKALFTFVKSMELEALYSGLFRANLNGRFVTHHDILPLLELQYSMARISVLGTSENGNPIHQIRLGHGPKKVLVWSQMHGNESTTTKAVFDLLTFFGQADVFQTEIRNFLNNYTLHIIPLLNPDGALAYTRENANGIDLNRDAVNLSQKESRLLRSVFDAFSPDLCLNLHDQRTIYGLKGGKPATISFLAPSEDVQRTVTATRKEAMCEIARIAQYLQKYIPDGIGRYDDAYNENCVGDAFTAAGVPTILFEAGHYPMDYKREKTREFIFYAFMELFRLHKSKSEDCDVELYFNIPENMMNFKDIIVRDVRISGYKTPVSLGIQYKEELKEGSIQWTPILENIGDLTAFNGHQEINAAGAAILVNYQQNVEIGEKITTIIQKNNEKILFTVEK